MQATKMAAAATIRRYDEKHQSSQKPVSLVHENILIIL